MSNTIDFGVQSYCFRHFKDNAVVASKVRGIGLDKIELCGIHANFDDPDSFPAVVDTYRQAGVSIVSIGVQTFAGNDAEENYFRCAAAAGAKYLSAHFRIESFLTAIPKVRAWSRKYGVKAAIHCHGGYMFGGSPDELEYLVSLGGPEIGICIDTAWCMQLGPYLGNPVEWAKRFAGKVYGVHFKDFVFEPNAMWKDVVVGTGNLNLPAFACALQENGFEGYSVIEYEADVEAPDAALKSCVESMRRVL